jgi:hypothetical protein
MAGVGGISRSRFQHRFVFFVSLVLFVDNPKSVRVGSAQAGYKEESAEERI